MKPIVASIGRDHYKTLISRGDMTWDADEPVPYGTDTAPSPYDFLLSALGGCIVMTLRMYIDRKGWDVESIQVKLTQNRIHAKDCIECESDDGYIHLIEKELFIKGNINEAQHKRINEIANKCPVHKTLLNEIKIESKSSVLI